MSIDKNELKFIMTELKKVFASKPDLKDLRDAIDGELEGFKGTMNEDLEGFKGTMNEDLEGFKGGINEDLEDFKGDINEDLENFKGGINEDLEDFKGTVNEDLESFKDEIKEDLKGIVSEDWLDFDPNVSYVGDEEPDNNTLIWFDTSKNESVNDEITFDNPIINELLACVRTLQDQVQQLQADVEYLKIYGGGGSSGGGTDNPEVETDFCLLLEDGTPLLWEDGSLVLSEEYQQKEDSDFCLLLEDGTPLLWEDGSNITLESYNNIV